MSLVSALNDLQREHGYLTEQTMRHLSVERRVPLHAIQAVVSFYPHFRTSAPPATTVAVCRDMACHLAGGGDRICEKLKTALSSRDVDVHTVSCLGRCEQAPALAINEVVIPGNDPKQIEDFARNPKQIPQNRSASPRRWAIDPYEQFADHYRLIKRLRSGEKFDVIASLKQSGLRGMGGAAFPTGVKWDLVSKQSDPVKYVVCNADESEPGTFKDRVILAELAHLVVEGVLIAAEVIGARSSTIFIRHEYGPERQVLAAEIEKARHLGIVDDQHQLDIFTSPGGYILGEETALLECMEDRRGEPRNKPPFPGQEGLFGKPTLINNVETFAAAVAILNRGVPWWKTAGVNGCEGLKFISVSGDVNAPDVYQIPMGTTVAELIEMAGGIKDGKSLKAFAPGGASSRFLPAEKANTPLDVDHLAKAGSMLGSGALFVVGEGADMMTLGTNVVRFFRNESCGKCVPCRVGSEKAVHMLEGILAEGGRREQLELLEELGQTLLHTSICGLGQVAIEPILSVIEHFPEDVAAHVKA